MPYHDSGEGRDGSETGEACGVTGIQQVGNHPANTACHEAGVQSVTSRKHQGSAVQNTCMERRGGTERMRGRQGKRLTTTNKHIFTDQSAVY